MKSVITCEKRRPPTTARPSGWRSSAPVPRPAAIGTAPDIAAKGVIMIGRKRSTHALWLPPLGRKPFVALRVQREVDHHDGVLLHDPDQHQDADGRDDREVLPEYPQREERS